MYNVYEDLISLYASHHVPVGNRYKAVIKQALGKNLAYATSAMQGLATTIFSSPSMVAYNLLQNSVDEAKGAARVNLIADRYASGSLKDKMKQHVRDELKHSAQFLSLLKVTGVSDYTFEGESNGKAEAEKTLDFDDELQKFICRVHSIEIRSWTILRLYMQIIQDSPNPQLAAAIPVLEKIMADEINHVLYTGQTISDWIESDPERDVASELLECFAFTNKETWHDMAQMSNFLAENASEMLIAA
ncbi:MAG: hypothetical protein KGM99_20460 [Burkholderiales bacterium]|nr:hypothetical protein [Burkholderiales bacterium]